MNKKHLKKLFIIFVPILVLASCVTQKYQQPGMTVQGPLYRDTVANDYRVSDMVTDADTLSIANLNYTQLFTDTVLQNLIAEGIRENLNLKTAVQRINEAYANLKQSKAAYWPSLDANGNVTRHK